MYNKENEEVSKAVKWAWKNKVIWELICGINQCEFTVREYIDMLEMLVADDMYQSALILLWKLDERACDCINIAISNVISNRINNPQIDIGIITECIEEIRNVAFENNLLEKEILLY